MAKTTPKVTGLGGFFFKSRDPAVLGRWYAERLGVPVEAWGGWAFQWRDDAVPSRQGQTVWSLFKHDTEYFAPSEKPFMVNFRVADLDAMRAALLAAGVEVDPRVEDSEFGRFGWCMDPEGNRIELWQPPEFAPPKKKARAKPKAKPKTKPKPRGATPKRASARRATRRTTRRR